MKNSLYTACKTGDNESLLNLLAVFNVPQNDENEEENLEGQGPDNEGKGQDGSLDLDKKNKIPVFLKPCGSDIQFDIEIEDDSLGDGLDVDPKQLFSGFQTAAAEENTPGLTKSVEQQSVGFGLGNCEKQDGQQPETVALNDEASLKIVDVDKIDSGPGDKFISMSVMDSLEKSNLSLNTKSSPTSSREGSRSRHSSGNMTKDALSPIIVTSDLLNETIGDSGMTLLMIAAKEGHKKLISLLMKAGCNPALRYGRG